MRQSLRPARVEAGALLRRLGAYSLCLALGLGVAAVATPAAAEDGDIAAKRSEFRNLFQQLLKDPTNLDLNLRYARLGAEIGDYEASVSALERFLIFNPDLPTVRLELGLLYIRLHSYAMARAYLDQAASAPNASADVRARAAEAIAKANSLSSPHQFAGMIEVGVQYQNDANAAPGSTTVPPFPFHLPSNVPLVKQRDSDAFVNAAGIYRYDLGNAESDTLEATGTLYQSAYFRHEQLNLGIAELTAGPRFTLDRIGIEHATFRPYLMGTYVMLDQSSFMAGGGGGVELAKTFDWGTLARLFYEHEERGYSNASFHPTASAFDGNIDVVRFLASQPIGSASTLDLVLRYVHEKTRFASDTDNQYRIKASYTVRYGGFLDPGFSGVARPWETSLEAGHDWIPYDAPNPAIDKHTARFDRTWFFGGSQFFYFNKSVSAGVTVDRQITSSNLPSFSFGDTTATFSVRVKF